MNSATEPTMPAGKEISLQRRLDDLSEAHLLIGASGDVIYANFAARALLEEADASCLSSRIGGWFDTAVLNGASTDGFCYFDREYLPPSGKAFSLRVRLHTLAGVAPAASYIALIEAMHPNALVVEALAERQRELERALAYLHKVQDQLLQSDKMASIGQLAAGVAHEINNPIGYVYSNLGTLGEYVNNLFRLIESYESTLREVRAEFPERWANMEEIKQQVDYQFLVKDLPQLLSESREGIERVRKIVEDLRDFSRAGYAEEWTMADLHRGLDSTLNIVWNDLKYKCDIQKHYVDIPQIECLPSQLNQVFMNILVNAGHAIEERGVIAITTGCDENNVFIDITDSGKGMPIENIGRIFDPFFTTKPVGQGTGLGLSLSYGIVRKHAGRIEVRSQLGIGTTFRVVLPLRQPARDETGVE